MRAIVIGTGRMGRLVREALDERGHSVSAFIGRHENAGGSALTPSRLKGIDVAIEFTTPAAAPGNDARLLAAGVPVVSGTTGWFDQLPALEHRRRTRPCDAIRPALRCPHFNRVDAPDADAAPAIGSARAARR